MNKALLVGINNYPNPSAVLHGCVNDISDMAEFLVKHCNFAQGDIRLLADERATTSNILERLNWLVDGIQSGDRLFFHYSGHGAQMSTRDHQGEIDGLDEVICPVDFDWTDTHVIRDKDFNRIFSSVPTGCEFVWVSDSCHSGDLSRDFPPPGTLWKCFPTPVDIKWRNATAFQEGLTPGTMSGSSSVADSVALISGCLSNQTSADATFNDRSNGALTYFLLQALNDQGGLQLPLSSLLDVVKMKIADTHEYSQTPGVEGSPEIIEKPFLAMK